MDDRCQVPGCRTEADLTYLGHGVCARHWNELTNETASADALRMALGISAAPEPLTENMTMSKKKTTEPKSEQSATETPQPHVAAVPKPAEKPVKVAKEGKAKAPKVEKVAK